MSTHKPHGPRLRDWSQPARPGEAAPPSAESLARRQAIAEHFRGTGAPVPEADPDDGRPSARQALNELIRPQVTSTGKQGAADALRTRMTRTTPTPDPTQT